MNIIIYCLMLGACIVYTFALYNTLFNIAIALLCSPILYHSVAGAYLITGLLLPFTGKRLPLFLGVHNCIFIASFFTPITPLLYVEKLAPITAAVSLIGLAAIDTNSSTNSSHTLVGLI